MKLLLYNLFLHSFVAPFLLAYYLPQIVLHGKYSQSLSGKLGRLNPELFSGTTPRPTIWFHAVSVGEVVALSPLVKQLKLLRPDAGILVSTGTETGQAKAHELITEAHGFLYMPIDFPGTLNPVLDRLRPDLFVLMETELWPNLIQGLTRRGARVVLANGRISDRSFPRYRRFRSMFAPTVEKIDLFLMSSAIDAERITAMGAAPGKVQVTGNTKFDAALDRTSSDDEQQMRQLLGIDSGETTLVAGSTHPGENEIVLDTYNELLNRFPKLLLVIVPRHVEKTPAIISAMKERGMPPPFLRSSVEQGETRNGRNVIIVDRTGELFKIFSLASVVFMGGSLVPKGGQNILEPVSWAKVVLFGPSMEDFRDARDILVQTGAGIQVEGAGDMAARMAELLAHPEKTERVGVKGREAVMEHLGSAQRNADILAGLLPHNSSERSIR